jgi:hypothetical protein
MVQVELMAGKFIENGAHSVRRRLWPRTVVVLSCVTFENLIADRVIAMSAPQSLPADGVGPERPYPHECGGGGSRSITASQGGMGERHAATSVSEPGLPLPNANGSGRWSMCDKAPHSASLFECGYSALSRMGKPVDGPSNEWGKPNQA